MVFRFHRVHLLGWADLAPSGRAFDPAAARAVIHDAVQEAVGDRAVSSFEREVLDVSIDRALLAEYGAWASGWRWAASALVPDDSLADDAANDALKASGRVFSALVRWRGFLEELAVAFGELPDVQPASMARDIEHAAARLLPVVVAGTGADDAWYGTFATVLSWYVDAKVPEGTLDRARVSALLDDITSGRFESWIAPGEAAAAAACAEIGARVATAPAPAPVDDLSAWLDVRLDAFTSFRSSKAYVPLRHDAHQRFVAGPERERDPVRADAMEVALDACRTSAAAGEALTFEKLSVWQSIVLGVPEAPFRTTDAFAKRGRERYPVKDARTRFDVALAQANELDTPIAVRAARVYLDLCFFHPFADGNARAARLALDHVLTRAGLGLHAVEPIFVVSRTANDASGAAHLATLVELLIGPSC